MITISVTQFIRPNGRQVSATLDVDDSCQEGYDSVKKTGCRITAEAIGNNQVNLCIEDRTRGDFDSRVCTNDASVIDTMEAMLKKFSVEKYDAWVENFDLAEES